MSVTVAELTVIIWVDVGNAGGVTTSTAPAGVGATITVATHTAAISDNTDHIRLTDNISTK
ncbi:hypothetical protein [Williamsia sp. D3]|uniref:hypothetical protein n=1 Tax=Williamsia sp. D3 TaxID=1313067 RepID=UPI0004287CEB|nr:hypothetical protein [Williamsia sp. D3]